MIRGLAILSLFFVFAACSDDNGDFVSSPDGNDYSSSIESFSVTSKSSSSVQSVVDPSTVVVGEMTDSRDGQTYKTVKIGTQTWMAENLNFKTDSSFCYDNVDSNCTKYGRLYSWSAAMDSVGEWSTDGKGCGYKKLCSPTHPVRGICPEGWHLPSKDEWNNLFNAVGGEDVAGKMLKSVSGWKDYSEKDGNGSDAYSFAVLPAGIRGPLGGYGDEGRFANFLTSTEYSWGNAYELTMYNENDIAHIYNLFKYNGHSVRCLKDESYSTTINDLSSSSTTQGTVDPSTVVVGEMTDSRDGQTYKTVKIGSQTWMAENLNYAYLEPTLGLDSSSFCYENDFSNCDKFGRLYLWSAAMDSAGVWSTNGADCGFMKICSPKYPVRGVCPNDWHLPTQAEWDTLFSAVGGVDIAGKMLKSVKDWLSSRDGIDAYSFAALPAGFLGTAKSYNGEGRDAYFWSSTANQGQYSFNVLLYYGYNGTFMNALYDKYYGFSVRCVKD